MADASSPATTASSGFCRLSYALIQRQPCPLVLHSRRLERGRARASSVPAEGPVKREQASDPLVSVWDSNAEGVRGRWNISRRRSSAVEDLPRDDDPKAEDSWQWWIPGPDDDAYAYEDASDDEEDSSFFSWLGLANLDVMSVVSIFKWLIPAGAILLLWFFGGPMLLMAILAFFPWLPKLVPSFLKLLWPSWNSQNKSRYRRHQNSPSDTKKRRYNGFWKWKKGKEFGEDDDYDEEELMNAESQFGDWGDFDQDFLMLQKISRSNGKTGLEKRRKKKEMPLIVRLLVAVFPFLRSWGGFL